MEYDADLEKVLEPEDEDGNFNLRIADDERYKEIDNLWLSF